jgi:hypothetical protein
MSWTEANALALIREVGMTPVVLLLPPAAGQDFTRDPSEKGSGAGLQVCRPVLGKSTEVK